MPMIDSYSFGHMTIDGRSFRKDVIIYPDATILCPWWRQAGHHLDVTDIQSLIDMRPDLIIAGTGSPGLMAPARDLQEALQKNGIEFVALPTGEAVKLFNERAETIPTGGCFHLTC